MRDLGIHDTPLPVWKRSCQIKTVCRIMDGVSTRSFYTAILDIHIGLRGSGALDQALDATPCWTGGKTSRSLEP